jgi:3-carboxy-cis,cis-muconate cycloisomerase
VTPFASIFVPEKYRASVSDEAWVAAMLEFEAALAGACAEVGLIPAEHAEQIAESCRLESFPAAELAQEGYAAGNPAAPLVKRLRAAVGEPAASSVHLGSTSQDVIDTAAMLVAARTIGLILEDLGAVADKTATLARAHRSTPIAGRTLLQQAVPTTFGAKCAVWLVAVLEARSELARIRSERLAVQLGGAAGTLGPLGQDGARVLALVAGRLGLAEPVLPWHTDRTRIAQIGAALTLVAGVVGKIGLDVALLAQTEVGEVAEGDGGGSSAMPQKQNPVGATVTRACVQLVRGHALVLSEALGQEHERATGAWHAEWAALAGALAFAGGAVSSAQRTLSGLVVDAERMRTNLDLTGGAIMAERVAVALAGTLGRDRADEVIGEAAKRSTASGRALRTELLDDPEIALPDEELERLLDPGTYLGSAEAFVDRALEAYGDGA